MAPGQTIAERYVVQREIGQGGMGQVLEVEHIALGRRFALKVLRLERWNDELVRRFNREARALAQIDTPRVAQVTDFGVDPEFGPFYVMELLSGETVEERLERLGMLPAREALEICAEICDALADVHAGGIVHRDLKPSNVGLPQAGPVRVKLLDFGLAASMDDAFLSRITQSQQILGSLPYMSPEQLDGKAPAPSMDVYAVGVMLFEALTGRLPFLAPSTVALIHQILSAPVPALPAELAQLGLLEPLLERFLAKDAAQRFVSVSAAAQALREAATKLPTPPAGAHPHTRVLGDGGMPRTIEASAQAAIGMSPTLMAEITPPPVAESGMRLSSHAQAHARQAHPSQPAPPYPLESAPLPHAPHGYGNVPTTDPMMPGPRIDSGVASAPASSGTWIFRIAVTGLVGIILAGLTAIAVVVGLHLLSSSVEERANVEAEPPAVPPLAPVETVEGPSETGALGGTGPAELGAAPEAPPAAPVAVEVSPTPPLEVTERRAGRAPMDEERDDRPSSRGSRTTSEAAYPGGRSRPLPPPQNPPQPTTYGSTSSGQGSWNGGRPATW